MYVSSPSFVTVKLSSPDVSLSPLHSPLAEHDVALVDDQVRVTDSLTYKVVGLADKEEVGLAGAGTGEGTGSEPPPPPPPHDDKKTVVRIKDKTLATI